MRVPSFALLCCCCCTQAELTGSAFDNGHGVENHERIFYGDQKHASTDLTENEKLLDDELDKPGRPGLDHFKTTDVHAAFNNVPEYSANDSVNRDSAVDGDSHDDHDHDHDDHDDVVNEKWTKAEQWGYAILANSCVVCLSLCGILIVKCTNGNNRRIIGDYFLGLVVSIMLGDSLLHIMPEVLGLHDHDHAHDHDDHDHDDEIHDDAEYYLVIAKMGTTLGTVYLFWFIQSLMSLTGCGHSHDHGHSHGHGEELGKVAPEPEDGNQLKNDETSRRVPVSNNGKSY